MTLREERIYKELTQKKAAELLGVSLRSYVMYENDPALEDSIKYKYFVHELAKYNIIDETHGILSQKQIIEACEKVFKDYDITIAIFSVHMRSGQQKRQAMWTC